MTTRAEADRWNAKYSQFYVTRWSEKSGRFVMIGRPHKTYEAAMAASWRHDSKHGPMSSFVDVVRPTAA
jgi:hypothetical protein